MEPYPVLTVFDSGVQIPAKSRKRKRGYLSKQFQNRERPLEFTDPTGYKIRLASNATDTQAAEYQEAINYLRTSKTAASLLDSVESAKEIITITFTDDDNDFYDRDSDSVQWDAGSGLLTKGGKLQSAAMGLIHELGHAQQDIEKKLSGKTVDQIEAENLCAVETPTASELGEPSRIDYYDASGVVRTEGPSSFTVVTAGTRKPGTQLVY